MISMHNLRTKYPSDQDYSHKRYQRSCAKRQGLIAALLCIFIVIVGFLPSPVLSLTSGDVFAAPYHDDTSSGQALYSCTTGLCLVSLGNKQAQTVVKIDTKTQSLHGYALSLDGTKIIYALSNDQGTSVVTNIY